LQDPDVRYVRYHCNQNDIMALTSRIFSRWRWKIYMTLKFIHIYTWKVDKNYREFIFCDMYNSAGDTRSAHALIILRTYIFNIKHHVCSFNMYIGKYIFILSSSNLT
jgi:hypothetical protein